MLDQEQNVRSFPTENGVAETICDELTTACIPCAPVLFRGEELEKIKSRVMPE